VVPSLNEGMGRVIVQAGFLGKPVVGTAVGGIPDLVENEKTGLLVEPRDSAAIVWAVACLLKDPALARQLGERLREKVLNGFTEKQMIGKIDALYRQVLDQKKL